MLSLTDNQQGLHRLVGHHIHFEFLERSGTHRLVMTSSSESGYYDYTQVINGHIHSHRFPFQFMVLLSIDIQAKLNTISRYDGVRAVFGVMPTAFVSTEKSALNSGFDVCILIRVFIFHALSRIYPLCRKFLFSR